MECLVSRLGHHRITRSRGSTAWLALVFAIGCGAETVELTNAVTDGGIDLPGLESIELSPNQSTLVIDDLAVQYGVQFVATGRFSNGETRNISDLVAWGVDNSLPGSFSGPGAWRSSGAAGGLVTVEARSGNIFANARITVVIKPVINDGNNPPPPNAPDLFDPAMPIVNGGNAPEIVYPAHEVMFPINVYRVLFQYNHGPETNVYRIRFQSSYIDMQVFTTSDRWQADNTTWRYLAATNSGLKATMTVAAVNSANPVMVYESAPIDIYFSQAAVEGAIYYWSTSSEGVMKGVLSDPTPTKFYTVAGDDNCVACHTVSRDGKRMALGYGGETLREISVPQRNVTFDDQSGDKVGWSTFSPDGTRLLTAAEGQLRLLNSDTGEPVGPNQGIVPLDDGYPATHPDWSPLGSYVAVSYCDEDIKNKDVSSCGIARIPYNGGAWGAMEILVEADSRSGLNNYFPKYSPDGRWLAYVHAEGKSKDQVTAELRIIPGAGGSPIVLAKANQRVGPFDDIDTIGNSMPTWAPTSHPGTQWIAFSSVRDYGKVLFNDGKQDQLWVTALDLRRAELNIDPSFAAFWLPLQDVTQSNHRAFWAVDSEEPCVAENEICDGFDNDCDGIVDEDCIQCEPDADACFDGLDNDCDGIIDEGCIG